MDLDRFIIGILFWKVSMLSLKNSELSRYEFGSPGHRCKSLFVIKQNT